MPDDAEALQRERDRRVLVRRYKRRLKAAAALLVSLAAGTFLACQREGAKPSARPNPAPNPTTPEVSNLPAPPAEPDASGGTPGSGGQSGQGGQGGAASGGKSNQVDRHEHRKGMPVRDNLVE